MQRPDFLNTESAKTSRFRSALQISKRSVIEFEDDQKDTDDDRDEDYHFERLDERRLIPRHFPTPQVLINLTIS
jgi:hypothetical protein